MNQPLDSLISTIRGKAVILDADLAELYGVPTKALNQAIKRNLERFPLDFMFQLTQKEWLGLMSQIAISSSQPADCQYDGALRSQIVTANRGGRRTPPYAFTEHGALMAANVLNSPQAVKMSVYVVRAFIQQRELFMAQADVLEKLARMDAKLLEHDEALRIIWGELQPLLNPPPSPPKPRIGFNVRENAPAFLTGKKKRRL